MKMLVACCVLSMLPMLTLAAEKDTGTFDSAGVKIAYDVAGQGETVILIHGLDSSAAMNWELPGTFKELAEKYHVVALDLRGHGRSDKPEGDAAYGQPMVDDVLHLMDHLKIQKAHIVGYSLGGVIAMKFVSDHPDRTISLTLGGMGWLKDGSMLQAVWEKMGNRPAGAASRPGRLGERMGGAHEGIAAPPAAMHGAAKLALTEEQVMAIKTPIKILVGDHDPCKKMYVDPLIAVRKDIPVVTIEDAGHLNCITKPQFKDELVKWIDANATKH